MIIIARKWLIYFCFYFELPTLSRIWAYFWEINQSSLFLTHLKNHRNKTSLKILISLLLILFHILQRIINKILAKKTSKQTQAAHNNERWLMAIRLSESPGRATSKCQLPPFEPPPSPSKDHHRVVSHTFSICLASSSSSSSVEGAINQPTNQPPVWSMDCHNWRLNLIYSLCWPSFLCRLWTSSGRNSHSLNAI